MGQVVDVFAGAGKVDEFAGSSHFRHAGEAFFKPIFDGFDVVIGGRLNGFDGGGIFKREVFDHFIDFGKRKIAESRNFYNLRLGGKGFEPV